jgi:uncharacterized membrane protein
MDIAVSDDRLSAVGRSAHDLGAAALFGGNLFARVGMHPALADVSEARERGRVVNHAWRRYGTVNSASLLAVLGGWGLARRGEAADRLLSPTERRLAHVKDATVIAVALTGIASAVSGVLFGRMEPDGAVELADGSEPSAHTPVDEARTKRLLNGLGAAHLLSAGALVTVNAALAQTNFRSPPVRRLLRRVR